MKKIIILLTLLFSGLLAKAQTPKILISYDANGNRILRYYAPARPAAPPKDTSATGDGAIASNESDSTDRNNLLTISKDDVKVYPNPSNDNFNIAVSAGVLNNNSELILIDQFGRVHLRKRLTQNVTTISTKGLANGAYYIVVNDGKSKASIRIVKADAGN